MRARRLAGAARREVDEPRPRPAPPCAVTPRRHQARSLASETPAPRPPAATPPPQSSSRQIGSPRQIAVSRRAVVAAPRTRTSRAPLEIALEIAPHLASQHAPRAPQGPLACRRSEARSGTWSDNRRGNWSGTDRDTRAPVEGAEGAEGAGTRAQAAEGAEARAIRVPVAPADLAGGGGGARVAATEEEAAPPAARGGEAATPPRAATRTLRLHGGASRHG